MSVFIGYPSFMAYQMMKGKKGNNDGFPSIPGMIARYSASGLTNEQMAANPVWVDKTGNGHDLQMKNFLWGGMSGVGGYNQNFNQWFVGGGSNKTVSDSSMKLVLLESDSQKVIYDKTAHPIGYTYNFYIKVTGIEGRTLNVSAGTLGGTIMSITEDGIYSINATVSDSWGNNMMYLRFPPSSSNNTVTIEQLPLYPGALVFDGVDDYSICDNFPILTKEKGYTVVALRQWLSNKVSSTFVHKGTINSSGAFVFEFIRNNGEEDVSSFGKDNVIDISKSVFSYQTSNSYNGASILSGDNADGAILRVGTGVYANYTNVVIWELVFLDHDATEEELTKIKDYFVKTYPWLFPDQAWTVTGKTNEDEDRATIANITGNGNDLVLSNFEFAEGSGYGLYGENYNDNKWIKPADRADITCTNYSANVTSVKDRSTQLYYQSRSDDSSFTVPSYAIKVYGLKDGQTLSYRQITPEGEQIYRISEDGIYTLPSFLFIANGAWYGFILNNIQESCDITIEQIPEYEGYLVTDGVDDRVVSRSFTLNKDWTLVGEWVLLNKKATNAGIVKPFSFVIYNRVTGLSLFINSGTSEITIENVKSIKAICSDGRIYLDDWSEMLINKDQNITSSTSVLSIGFNGTAYTQIALKNLGIYNDQLLSKDDCIKAYNYLQTLKAK